MKNGAALAADFYDHIIEIYFDDFGSENIWEDSGYSVSHWVGGSGGDEMQNDLMHFIYNLCPDIHAQSWGCGDDDPWEFWFKYENGQVLHWYDEPFEGKKTIRRMDTFEQVRVEQMSKDELQRNLELKERE